MVRVQTPYKVQIWVALIANLLLTLLQCGIKRTWSFSGLATMIKLTALYKRLGEGFVRSITSPSGTARARHRGVIGGLGNYFSSEFIGIQ